MSLYKKDDVARIFDEEKVLAGNKDVFPRYRAVEIFGEKAVKFAEGLSEYGSYACMYGIGDYQFEYLTLRGTEVAATYVNICNIRDLVAVKGGDAA